MRARSLSLVATIATSVTIACSDAAVEHPTAPTIAATPASPVANQFPSESEILAAGWTSSMLGIQITISPYFEADYRTFVVPGVIRFQAKPIDCVFGSFALGFSTRMRTVWVIQP